MSTSAGLTCSVPGAAGDDADLVLYGVVLRTCLVGQTFLARRVLVKVHGAQLDLHEALDDRDDPVVC